jgi:hypothetical protein
LDKAINQENSYSNIGTKEILKNNKNVFDDVSSLLPFTADVAIMVKITKFNL